MNMNSTYKTVTNAASRSILRSTAGLDPFVHSAERPWNRELAAHLLRRTTFGPTPDEIDTAVDLGLEASVEKLFEYRPFPDHPGTWVGEDPYVSPTQEERQERRRRTNDMRYWWLQVMMEESFSIREKMTFFWHDHFANEVRTVVSPQRMYKQNDTFRYHATRDFRQFLLTMNVDPAMLIYLDGRRNRVGNPNENYARELLELFTLGEGQGYTQQDIEEAARALTGWVVVGLNPEFREDRFDDGEKEFMGKTGALNGYDIVQRILEQDRCAEYICEKFYSYLVYHDPDPDIISEMAATFRENNFKIQPVLEQLLLSEHFYDESFIGSKIKNPLDLVVGAVRSMYGVVSNQTGSESTIDYKYLTDTANLLGLYVFDPPNVAGWQGYRAWISTATLPNRNGFTDGIVDGNKINGQNLDFQLNPVTIAEAMTEPNNAIQLIDDLADYYLAVPLETRHKEYLQSILLEGAEVYDFSLYSTGADARVARTLKALMRLPEFQLI